MIRRRSRSVVPPQTPSFSRQARACSRHAMRTSQVPQTEMATSAISSSPSSGKNTAGSSPWHAPRCRHEMSMSATPVPPPCRFAFAVSFRIRLKRETSVTHPPIRDGCLTDARTLGPPCGAMQTERAQPACRLRRRGRRPVQPPCAGPTPRPRGSSGGCRPVAPDPDRRRQRPRGSSRSARSARQPSRPRA